MKIGCILVQKQCFQTNFIMMSKFRKIKNVKKMGVVEKKFITKCQV